jgi:predicted MPP superfamily phosphohydrolase
MQKRDFSTRRFFPGTRGNSFDVLLHAANALQKLPAPVFALLLFLPAWAAARFQWPPALLLWAFMAGDWCLLALLPRMGKSYGPSKPPALALALMRAPFALLPLPVWLPLQLSGTLLVIYGFWIEPHRLTVTRQRLQSPKLKPGAALRLLHLGDLHVERITDRERALVELAGSLEADLIVFSGDFLNLSYLHDPEAWEACRWVLGQLRAPLGVYAVAGSPAVDLPEVLPKLLEGMPLCWLQDEVVTVESALGPIDIAGLSCSHKPFVDGPKLVQVLTATPPLPHRAGLPRFTILLYHTPDLAPEAAEAHVDLQLSGHTHGGQVRLPWYGAIFAGSLYGKAFESGRRTLGGMTLYVARGIGLEGAAAPRVRFLCPPEIVLWEIAGSESG